MDSVGLSTVGRSLGHRWLATTAIYAHLDDAALHAAAETAAGQIAKAMGFKTETMSKKSDNAQMRPHPPDLFRIPQWVMHRLMQTVAETPSFTRQADRLFARKGAR